MSQTMTLELTEEFYEAVKSAAAQAGLPPNEWVVNRLQQHLPAPPGSPQALLQALQQMPRLAAEDVDALEQAIKEGALPPDWTPVFPDCEQEAA